MGIFGALKNRILGRREENLDEIRSHVLGEPIPERDFSREEVPEFPETDIPVAAPNRFETPTRFEERKPFGLEDTGYERTREDYEKRYDIIERLNLIEAQLQAIRSSTETINERLKNMEMRLPRRY